MKKNFFCLDGGSVVVFLTFESFCIILANSFFKNCLTCVKVQFFPQETKQTFPKNLKSKKRDYHFQTEVIIFCKKEIYKKSEHQLC